MDSKKVNILEKLVKVLDKNGFKNVFYTSNGDLVYMSMEQRDFYLDENGNDRYLEYMPGRPIKGCCWVENPKFTIFKNIVNDELKGSGYSFMGIGSVGWSLTNLVNDNSVMNFYKDIACN